MTAIDLAKRLGKKVEAISVYDPYLHYSVFNGVVDVLTEKAAKVFRFEEQNQLHEEIIDTGLAQIYQSHLEVAEQLASQAGVELTKTLLDGKAFQKVLDHARKIDPFLLVVGRIGVHSDAGDSGLGSNTENLLRSCPCDMLLTTRLVHPELDLKAEETIRWTPEAEDRLKGAPSMVRGIARTAIYRLAVEQGHSVITSAIIDEAMKRYMPMDTARQTAKLAEAVAIERARADSLSICKKCGVTAAKADPEKCSVCGAAEFERISEEMLERIVEMEGGAKEEATYDGRKLKWTQDAKHALWTMQDAYKRRRVKARVEKSARGKKLPTVTLEFARPLIEEETGEPLVLPKSEAEIAAARAAEEANRPSDKKLVARDEKNNPLFSGFAWTDDAVGRLFQVPAGFMRDRTQVRVEQVAGENGKTSIDLATVEGGIELGRQAMEELLTSSENQAAGETPKAAPTVSRDADTSDLYLNEVGVMSQMANKRKPE
jgi:nucleotide-binding universal stress UspA family protein